MMLPTHAGASFTVERKPGFIPGVTEGRINDSQSWWSGIPEGARGGGPQTSPALSNCPHSTICPYGGQPPE